MIYSEVKVIQYSEFKMVSRRSLVPCSICNSDFLSENGLGKYCSDKCSVEGERELHKKRLNASGKFCVGDQMPCKDCGITIIKKYPRHLFCEECKKSNQRKSRIKSYHNNRDNRIEGLKISRAKRKENYKNNPEIYEEYLYKERLRSKERRKDPKQSIDYRMSNMIRLGLKGKKQGRSWLNFVDYTLEELMGHLESKFLDNMSWDNMSEWHIDHIIPRSRLEYNNENDPEFKVCWSLENLQPLWALDNLKKSNKLNYVLNVHEGE